MKKNTPILPTIILLSVILSIGLISCKKTTTGPAGAQGAPGPQGNANVKSFVFTTGNNWKADSTNKNFEYEYPIADLNTSVFNNGAVMLYLSDEGGNAWKPLPFSNKDLNFTFEIELSNIEIFVSSSDNTMPANPGAQKFKLVIIPPAS